MSQSPYSIPKHSLGGLPSGLIAANDADLAQLLDAIAFPGMTANFDAAKSADLAMTLLDRKEHGRAYGQAMRETAKALAAELLKRGMKVFAADRGGTQSHLIANELVGRASAKLLHQANIPSCGIGLPSPAVNGDLNGLRIGTPEIVRWGMTAKGMPQVSTFIADILLSKRAAQSVAAEVADFRAQFKALQFTGHDLNRCK